jgi:hypothetical protein
VDAAGGRSLHPGYTLDGFDVESSRAFEDDGNTGGSGMAAIAFDTLKFARRLKEVGVPEAQAEAQAELMAEAFVYNMDSLVTKDYLDECLDARFAAQDLKLEKRFNEIDNRFTDFEKQFDGRFNDLETQFGTRFSDLETKFGTRFSDLETKFGTRFSDLEMQLGTRFSELEMQFGSDQNDLETQFSSRLNDFQMAFERRFSTVESDLKLQRWILAAIAASTVIPAMMELFGR